MKKYLINLGIGIAILAVFVVLPVKAAGTIVVSGNTSAGENQPGWMFNRDVSTSTPFQFNNSAASIGNGSLYVQPITNSLNGNNDKFIAENFINTPISNLNTISYDFKIGSGGDAGDKDHFYMNVYANFGQSDDLKFYDCRYNIVPSTGSTSNFTTVIFDPTQSYPVTTRGDNPNTPINEASPATCPTVPADMNNISAGSNIRAFALNVGDTSNTDQGLDGFLDKVVVDKDNDGVTIYDFDPAPTGSPSPTPTTDPFAAPEACSSITFSNSPIVGTNGSDTINGTAGNDLIFGLNGADKIDGKGGDDCIVGGNGADKLIGGDGKDVIQGGNGADTLDGGKDNDKLYAEASADSLKGGAGDDELYGGDDADSLWGDGGKDKLYGDAGADSLKGGADDDELIGGTGVDSARGDGGSADVCDAESENSCELNP